LRVSQSEQPDPAKLREALHQAIDALLVAELDGADAELDSHLVLTDWIVVAARRGFDPTGDGISRVSSIPSASSPNYALLGLLQAGTQLASAAWAGDD
jgi:hypothetical protein